MGGTSTIGAGSGVARAANAAALLSVSRLSKCYPFRRGGGLFGRSEHLHAVSDVSFEVPEGQTLGIVGESGCGKSTLARLIMRLVEPTSGNVRLSGVELTGRSQRELRPLRRDFQMVFQDPSSSLNPRLTVRRTLREVVLVHGVCTSRDADAHVGGLLESVGLRAADMHKYPHELSGGQKQRVCIARAIAPRPRLLVADEAVSALDASVQAQVLNLLADLREAHRLTIVFISHDLRVVRHFCDRVLVMYLGRVVEDLAADAMDDARHPYTRALLASSPPDRPPLPPPTNPLTHTLVTPVSSTPARQPPRAAEVDVAPNAEADAACATSHGSADRRRGGESGTHAAASLVVVRGETSISSGVGEGCAYAPRCPLVMDRCRRERPGLEALKSAPERRAACFAPGILD